MSEQSAVGTHQVSRVLTKVGRRTKTARLLPLLVLTLALGVAALGGAIIYLGQEWPSAGWPIAGATALALLALGGIGLAGRRGIGVVARRLDYELRLSEQLSTAVGPLSDEPVARSLRVEADRIAGRLEVSRAVPILTRRLGISLAVLATALCGTAVAYGVYGESSAALPSTGTAAIEAAEAGQPITAESLEVLAELVANDAERRDSDYLDALANSIERLAQTAREGAGQAELEAQLEALLDHASAGYDGALPDWMNQNTDTAGGTLQNAVAFNEARQQAAAQRERLAALNGEGTKINSAEMYTLNDDRLTRSALPQPAGEMPPLDNAVADREGELASAPPSGGDSQARPMEDEAFASAGSLPVGAAAQSGKGESNIAGGGSQALAEDAGYLETMADPTQSMSIAADNPAEGSRIRMHVPTQAEATEAGELGDEGDGAWARQIAHVVSRQSISPSAGPAVSRYFNRPTVEPER